MPTPVRGQGDLEFVEEIEGDLEVDLGEGVEEEPAPEIDENSPNLVPAYATAEDGREFLRKLAKQVIDDVEDALESSEEYRQKIANNYKIYAGMLPPKEWPYKNSSNAHIPIMLEVISRLSSRMYGEIFLVDPMWFEYAPTGPDDTELAEICTKHSTWQFENEILDWNRQVHRAILLFVTNGDVFAHSFRDNARGVNRHETLSCDDVVIPYVHTSTMPDLSDCPFVAKILRLNESDVEGMRDEWHGVDEVLEGRASYDDEPEAVVRNAIAEVQGIVAPEGDAHAPHSFYQYDGFIKLPGGGKPRAICATVHVNTKAVVRLYIREEEDWRDRIRFDRQMEELQAFMQAQAQYEADAAEFPQAQAAYAEYAANRSLLQQKLTDPMEQGVDDQERALLGSALEADELPPPEPPVAPMPPSWLKPGMMEPEPVRKVPMNMFAHGTCLENPLGVLGLSYGHILGDHNRAANNALNLFNDAAALANNWSILAPSTFELESGALEIAPGKINLVQGVSGMGLREAIVELKPGPANSQLMEIVDRMYDYSQSSIAAPDALSGESGKSGETYRGLATRIEQALKQLSVSAHKFVSGWLGQVLRNNAKLNSMFLPDEQMVFVVDHILKRGEMIKVGRQLYQRNYKVTIRADMRFVSQQQRIAEADQILGMAGQLGQAMPGVPPNVALLQAAAARALKARNAHDLLPLLGPPAPPPQTPMAIPMPPPMVPPGMSPPGVPPGPPPPGPPPEGEAVQGTGGPAPQLQ